MDKDLKEAQSENDYIDLYEIFSLIAKRAKIIAAICALAMIAAGIVSYWMKPVYRVSASLMPGWLSQADGGKIIYVDTAQNIMSTINNGSYNAKVREMLLGKISNMPDTLGFATDLPRGSDIVHISYETPNIDVGKKIMTELLRQLEMFYNERVEPKLDAIDKSIQLLENKIQIVVNKKAKVENEKKKILSNIQLSRDKMVLLASSEESTKKQIKEVEVNTKDIMNQRSALLEQGKDVKDAVSLLLYSNTIQQNISYADRLNLNYEKVKLDQESEKNELKKMELDIKDKDIELKDLDAEISDNEQEIEKLKLSKKEIEGIRIIMEPTASASPVRPKKMFNIVVAGLVTAFVCVFIVLVYEWNRKERKIHMSMDRHENV